MFLRNPKNILGLLAASGVLMASKRTFREPSLTLLSTAEYFIAFSRRESF